MNPVNVTKPRGALATGQALLVELIVLQGQCQVFLQPVDGLTDLEALLGQGIVRLNGLDLQSLQLRTSRLQFDATRPAQRLGLV